MTRLPYEPPRLDDVGTVADITRVGQTNPSGDMLPEGAEGKDEGSVDRP